MKINEYLEENIDIIFKEDIKNFIEYIKPKDTYIVHYQYDGGDFAMKTNSTHQAFIILGLGKYGYSQEKIRFTLDLLLK